MFTFLSRRRLRQLEATELLVDGLRKQAWDLSLAVAREQAQRTLLEQAKTKADEDAAYWKTRAERFLDQIGLRSGIMSVPTMTEPEPGTDSHMETVFSHLGIQEINSDKSPVSRAAPAAPVLTGVDPAAAQAAIDDALQSVRRLG